MPKLHEVVSLVRSKAAGPFWITVDIFFDGASSFARYYDAAALSPAAIADLYLIDLKHVRRTAVDELHVLKISFPRPSPQGWIWERDMHCGQQYVRMMTLELNPETFPSPAAQP